MNPNYFLGGERKLYPDRSKSAISKFVAKPLGIKIEQAASGIIQLVNSQMANGVSTNSVTTLYTQGAVNQTGKITDMAIAGEGYFIVKEYTNKGAINNAETGDGAAPGIAEPDKAKKTTPLKVQKIQKREMD